MTGAALTRWSGTAGATAAVAAVCATVFAAVPPEYALAVAVLIAGTFAAYRLPVLSLSALVIVGVGPLVLSRTGLMPDDMSVLFGKVRLTDAIMVFMILAVSFKAVSALVRRGSRSSNYPVALAVCYGAFFAWIAVSVLRNLDVYGLRTVGQFRFSFLILVVPGYATVFLRSFAQRRSFCVFLLIFSVAVPLAAMPLVVYVNGWMSGLAENEKFFSAWISLGLLYGWTAMILASERETLRIPKWLARGLAFPVAAELLVDSHRSVWFAALVLLAYFLVLGRLSAGTFARMALAAAAVAVALFALAGILGLEIVSFVVSRGSALFSGSSETTASWRLDLWVSNLALWRQHPLAGTGFGAYYTGNAAVLGVPITTEPHNYYVEALVSMGAIGLALLVAVVVVAGATLWNAAKRQRRVQQESLDATLVDVGLGVLLSALAFCIAYPVGYYPCLWVGLALAAAVGLRRTEPPATAYPPSRP